VWALGAPLEFGASFDWPLLTLKAQIQATPEVEAILKDLNGAVKVYERAFQVSPVKGSSGRVARPVVRSFHLGWRRVHEPKRKGSPLCASPKGCPRINPGEDVTASSPQPLPRAS
jgi:hypothetical protein